MMIIKFAHVMLLAAIKFILTLPYAMIIGLDYKEALVAVLIGGIGGFLFFYYLSKSVVEAFKLLRPKLCQLVPTSLKNRFISFCERQQANKKVKIFTRKNRFLARFKKSYGFWGLVLATPLLLTIPVGAFLANKYYSHRRNTVLYMIMSIVGWTAVLSGLIHLFPKVFF